MKKSLLSAALALLSTTAFAQYITEAPAGGFDFTKGKDYVVLYAPEAQMAAMSGKITTDMNLDPDMEKNQFYYWTYEWDAKQLTLYDIEDTQANSWGGKEKLNMTPLKGYEWGAGAFTAKSQKYDISKVTDDHILHIGFMNIGTETATNNFKFLLGKDPEKGNGFPLIINKALGSTSGKMVGAGMAPAVNKWYYLDIPVKDLVDEDGDFGFEYDFSQPIDIIFTVGFDKATGSAFTKGAIDPESGLYTITITEKGSALALDGVYFYKADESAGVNEVKAATKADNGAIYNLAGQQVSKNYKGVVVKNGKKFIQK